MGGAAFIIQGEVDAGLLPSGATAETNPPASFWARLLGWRHPGPKRATVQTLSNGDRHFEIPPGSLEGALVAELRRWLATRIEEPSEGTKVVLEYLAVIEPTVYLRGLQRASEDKPEFYVQLTFSGCAGTSETSARVCVHWAALWYADAGEKVRAQYLEPFGFRADPKCPPDVEHMLFLPAGPLGYVEYVESGGNGQAGFEADEAATETPEGQKVLDELPSFERFMQPPRCRCQLCEPEFRGARGGVA